MKIVRTVRKQCESQAALMHVIEEIRYRNLCVTDLFGGYECPNERFVFAKTIGRTRVRKQLVCRMK